MYILGEPRSSRHFDPFSHVQVYWFSSTDWQEQPASERQRVFGTGSGRKKMIKCKKKNFDKSKLRQDIFQRQIIEKILCKSYWCKSFHQNPAHIPSDIDIRLVHRWMTDTNDCIRHCRGHTILEKIKLLLNYCLLYVIICCQHRKQKDIN